jgi:hypothetical protein
VAPEKLFSLFSILALLGWLMLILAPRWRPASRLIAPVIIPSLIAILYIYLMATRFAAAEGGFGTLADVKKLLADDHLLLGGWIHYLAFDLFIGAWEVRDSQRRGIRHLAVIPCLALTFYFGPAGLLLYLIVRAVTKKVVAVEEGDALAR